MCVRICACMCVHVHVDDRGQCQVFSSITFRIIFNYLCMFSLNVVRKAMLIADGGQKNTVDPYGTGVASLQLCHM